MLGRVRRTLPPLDSLWAFHVVAGTGSLTAAAVALGVTQPAVSKRLRDLEAALGCALVRRGANAIRLTEAGERFAEGIARGFAQIQAATNALRPGAAPLRIRAYTTWALRWLIPRLPAFRAAHPGIDVEVSTSTAPVDLLREGVDAAVRTAPIGHAPAPGARCLQPVSMAPFAAPALAPAWRPRERTEVRLLGSRVRREDWPLWLAGNGIARRPEPLLFESTSLAIQAALEGLGIVICAPEFVREEVREGRLVALEGRTVPTGDAYWLILPPGRIGAPLRTFAEWLTGEAAVIR